MKGESLERVVAEAQLRPGMLVELKTLFGVPCGRRYLLVRPVPTPRDSRCSQCETRCTAWRLCDSAELCAVACINQRSLYIVNPFDEQEAPVSAAKSRPKERTNGR